jgi:DNA processing protein
MHEKTNPEISPNILQNVFPQLREIPQPPKKLYMRGTLPSPETKLLTVVGSRRFSSYGKMACEKIISELEGYDISIVSGLALGIDTIAHRAALKANLHTIAIPGSGLDDEVIYPATNRNLAQEILQSGGALISEYEPDFKATVWSFPRRNRIMAGISDAVLIIESQKKSGTQITARLALDYNKGLFAIPGSIFSEASDGTNLLIKQGAVPITCGDDILDALNIEKKVPENADIETDDTLSDAEVKILIALAEPITKDELLRMALLPIEEISATLTVLEIKGHIQESGGKLFRK